MYLDCGLCVVSVLYVLNNENQRLMHPGHYSIVGLVFDVTSLVT
jgi:hypothetical protein